MNTPHTPKTVAPPFGHYSHAVEISKGSRILYTAGQVGAKPDGTIPNTIEEQAELCWQNLQTILKHAGFEMKDIVKITTYLLSRDQGTAAMKARAKYLGDHRPASATIVAAALGLPEWLIEIEAVAAQ